MTSQVWKTLDRVSTLLFIVVVSTALAFFIPSFGSSTGRALHVIVLYSFLLGFFINRALERRHRLISGVAAELVALRRIRHLMEKIGTPMFRKHIRELLMNYEKIIGTDFNNYSRAHGEFRKITHRLYDFSPQSARETVIYGELLTITRELARDRETISSALSSPQGFEQYLTIGFAALLAIFILLIERNELGALPITASISGILIGLDLFLRTDRTAPEEIISFALQYQKNLRDRG